MTHLIEPPSESSHQACLTAAPDNADRNAGL
jgi:hypothetical protein